MQTIQAHRNEFIRLLGEYDEKSCLEHIDKYDDFYNVTYSGSDINMLQYACMYRLVNVAIALIDRKCDLTYEDNNGHSALIYASSYGLKTVVTHIINNRIEPASQYKSTINKISEMMYLTNGEDTNNVGNMIDKGYDVYYEYTDPFNRTISLLSTAIAKNNGCIIKKLIDIDIDFIEKFNKYCNKNEVNSNLYNYVKTYCVDKYDGYKNTIIAAMNDASPTNALYQSFRATYAVELVDVICDFILLKM
ncbi:MAG: hypothetical protein Faunusvirus64_5 [Faunusvirus sp.]|jgi:hypothetical protein|uniref:Uncharacterized protein n=1 Tax=Faunusvirus sp. TaxID=2487766 RepID=A0A3G4ZY68_9VIRU|nr:MAG: hypothetical protein Faunusvirus64_5 [Faunusvirus sp.]